MKYICIITIFLIIIIYIKCTCPNYCNGHGYCNTDNVCDCVSPYNASSDCSLMTCPYGAAWASKPYDSYAHHNAECSNAGLCNRLTGVCECFPGFEGFACHKLSCDCIHGYCSTIGDLYNSLALFSILLNDSSYSLWDSNHTTICICDMGYIGTSCDQRMCPKGNDPIVTIINYPVVQLTTSASSGILSGHIKLIFNGYTFSFPANAYDYTSIQCKESFENLPNIESVSCVTGDYNEYAGTNYTIEFLKFSTLPYENNIYSNTGFLYDSMFVCDVTAVTGAYDPLCNITVINSGDGSGYYYCSNHGVCDFNSGKCTCEDGFTNSNCDTLTSTELIKAINSYDVLDLRNIESSYTGNILNAYRELSSNQSFNFISVQNVESDSIFQITSTGDMDLNYGGMSISDGLIVKEGGAAVTGGLTVTSGGIVVTNGMTINSGGLHIKSSSLSITGGLSINNNGLNILNGSMNIYSGGLYISNGLTIYSQGVAINAGGINIGKDGLTVTSNGLYLSNGVTVWSGGLVVTNGDVSVVGPIVLSKGGLTLTTNGLFITTGGVSVDGSLSILSGGMSLNNGLYVTNGLTISEGGMIVSGGITVLTKGASTPKLVLSSSNLNLLSSSSKLFVTGGITAHQLNTFGSLSVYSTGTSTILVSNGVSITGGMILTGGLSIIQSMYITGGITVSKGGLVVSNGMTVADKLVLISGGLTVNGGNVYITNGLTVNSIVYLSNGLVVNNGGLYSISGTNSIAGSISVTGGVTINSGGLYASTGLTVYGGLVVTGTSTLNGGLTITTISIASGNMAVTGGMTNNNNFISGSLSLNNGLLLSNALNFVTSGNFYISGQLSLGGLAFCGQNFYITSGGLITRFPVTATGLYTDQSSTLYGAITIVGGLTVKGAAVHTTSPTCSFLGLNVYSGMVCTDGMSVMDTGFYSDSATYPNLNILSNGASIIGDSASNNMIITSGTLTIDGTVVVTNGVTVSGGLTVYNGISVGYDGIVVSNGFELLSTTSTHIINGGVYVLSDGVNVIGGTTVNDGTVSITGGLTINSNGMFISGGLTINSGGLFVTKGLSIIAGGLYISNGLTVYSSGVIITNGCSITTNGLQITGGSTNFDSGMIVTNGITVNGGIYIPSLNLQIKDSGVVIISRGLTVMSSGLRVTGGVTVRWDGMFVTGGMSVTGPVYLQSDVITPSDINLKENITLIEDPVYKLNNIHGVYYYWNNSNIEIKRDDRRHIGVIAQDVQKVLPEAVHNVQDINNESYLSVRYNDMIPLLIQAIKEINNNIDSKDRSKQDNVNVSTDSDINTIINKVNKLESNNRIIEQKLQKLKSLNN